RTMPGPHRFDATLDTSRIGERRLEGLVDETVLVIDPGGIAEGDLHPRFELDVQQLEETELIRQRFEILLHDLPRQLLDGPLPDGLGTKPAAATDQALDVGRTGILVVPEVVSHEGNTSFDGKRAIGGDEGHEALSAKGKR